MHKALGLAGSCFFGLLLFISSTHGENKKRHSWEPPLSLDFDMQDIPEPKERQGSFYYDFLHSTFALQAKEALDLPRNFRKMAGKPKEGINVNVLGEVPDSSWFANRNATHPLTPEEVARGPNRGTGPAGDIWVVIQGKGEGITPGFLIRDAQGQIYQLKFDPPSNPEMATAAEVIAAKLYHAAGYNVKENFIVVFPRHRLRVGPEATMKDRYGRPSAMTEADLEGILGRVARRPDGQHRAEAGKWLEGIPKGPFQFEGVRKDDPNDWIPHEHRRDLRGLRVVCSWLNENDMREGNTLDMYVTEGGRRFLRHYLLDLGSSLGSDTIHPNIDRIGNEYQLDAGEIAKSLLSFGAYRRPWKGSSKTVLFPSVGFLEAEIFDPGRWKPNYPILAFENMTLQDAFWGTKLVLSFTEAQIRAAVESGQFSDRQATEFLTRVLIQRRDKIGRYWLSRVNPLDRFELMTAASGQVQLKFADLETEHGYVQASDRGYEYAVQEEGRSASPVQWKRTSLPVIDLSDLSASSVGRQRPPSVFQVSIRTYSKGRRQGREVRVYVGNRQGGASVLGVARRD